MSVSAEWYWQDGEVQRIDLSGIRRNVCLNGRLSFVLTCIANHIRNISMKSNKMLKPRFFCVVLKCCTENLIVISKIPFSGCVNALLHRIFLSSP